MPTRIRGALAPVLTPFDRHLQPDTPRFIAHCRWLVDNGVGLAIFGTNSEAASLSVAERLTLTDALLEAGIPAERLMPGTGACSVADAITLTRHAVSNGAAGALMLPPFYFKNASDQGLFDYYATVIDTVADPRLKVYLYHIPQFTQTPITLNLIEMLRKRYPDTVVGAKDSSGVWENTQAMIDQFASDGFDVFPASESLLTKALSIGGAGCISATVNMNPAGIRAVVDGWNGPNGAALQAKADVVRQIFQAVPMIPAMKRVVAECASAPSWAGVRPPLVKLDDATATSVMAALNAAGFAMSGYPVEAPNA